MRKDGESISGTLWRLALRAAALAASIILAACGAQKALSGFEPGERVTVARAVSGDSVALADGTIIRLAEIEAPARAGSADPDSGAPDSGSADSGVQDLGGADGPGPSPASAGTAAEAALGALTAGKKVLLAYGGRRATDKAALAQIFILGGKSGPLWVQKTLIERGLARVHTWPDNRVRAGELLSAEARARAAHLGLWAEAAYAPLEAQALALAYAAADAPHKRGFQLVEGVIAAVEARKGRTYLNFGDNWRIDFTASVADAQLSLWPHGGADLESLRGKHVRIRGYLGTRNGPAIEVTHPEQIEILS